MNDPQEMELQLWDYIDGLTIGTQKQAVEKLISDNGEWKQKYNELLEVKQLMEATELEHPSLRFTKNVMDTIAQLQIAPATKKYINNKIIFGLAFFFIALIFGFIIYGIGQIDWTAGQGTGTNLSNFDYNKIFNNNFVNLFMVVNVVLGLMILDKVLAQKNKRLRSWKGDY